MKHSKPKRLAKIEPIVMQYVCKQVAAEPSTWRVFGMCGNEVRYAGPIALSEADAIELHNAQQKRGASNG